jgi:hypothetical protein
MAQLLALPRRSVVLHALFLGASFLCGLLAVNGQLKAQGSLSSESTLSKRVVVLDDHGGQVFVRGSGSASNYVIRYDFDGFYVWAIPAATDFVKRSAEFPDVPTGVALLDVYYVIPKKTTLTIHGTLRGVDCQAGGQPGSDAYTQRTGRFFYRDVIEVPDLTETDARVSVPKLMGRIVSINISDQRPLNGPLTWNFLGNTFDWKIGLQRLGTRTIVTEVGQDGTLTTGTARGREDWVSVFQNTVETESLGFHDGQLRYRLNGTRATGVVRCTRLQPDRRPLAAKPFEVEHVLGIVPTEARFRFNAATARRHRRIRPKHQRAPIVQCPHR